MEFKDDKSVAASIIFNKYAKEYQDKFMDVSLYEGSLNAFCKLVTKGKPKILDLACGPGNITKYLLSKNSDLMVIGIDLAPNMIQLARHNNPEASFEVMDCRSIGNLTEKFDAVICSFCLPYLSIDETSKLFSDVYDLLNEGGIYYISTMEDDYANSRFETSSQGDQIYMHYYEGQYLISSLEEKKFTIVETFRYASVMSNGKEVIDLVLIVRKKEKKQESNFSLDAQMNERM